MSADSSLVASVSVIVLATDNVDDTAATLRLLIGQSEAVEVIVPCDASMGAELLAMWGSHPPDGLLLLTTPPEMSSAQRAMMGCNAARGDFIGFAAAGGYFHPRHFALMAAAAISATPQGGVCLRVDATEPGPATWDAAVRHQSVRQLLDGSLVAESVLVSAAVLRTCGGPAADAGDAWLFALALRVALEVGLGAAELPEPARPSPPTSSPAMPDASIAGWLQVPAVAAALGASGLVALREASAGGWPLTRRALDQAADLLLADLPLLVGTFCHAGDWREALLARLPRAVLRKVNRSAKPLALLATLAARSEKPTYVMLAGDAPPDIDQLVGMCLRMEADRLDACLPFIDDGLLHASTPDGLLRGTLFRRARLAEVLSTESIQHEYRFWTVFSGRATIGAAGVAAPRRPEPRPEIPVDTSAQIGSPSPDMRRRSGRFAALLPGFAWLARLHTTWALRSSGLATARPLALFRKRPDPVAQLVDAEWYGRRLPAGVPEGVRASDHYRRIGWRDGFDPNPFFPTAWYLENNPDVRQLGICPLEHYVSGGAAEMIAGRMALPFFDPVWYAENYGLGPCPAHMPMVDLVLHGAGRGRLPHPLFEHEAVRLHLENVEAQGRGAEMMRLWALRAAISRQPHVYSPIELPLLATVLLWLSAPRTVPVVALASETCAEREAVLWGLRAAGETLDLSTDAGGHVLFAGASRHSDVVNLLTAVGARFDRLAVEKLR